jgi:E3 ubiquitin-protein ligase DOA10
MFSKEIIDIFTKVVSSWQVILTTVVLVLYCMLINYVSRSHHRSRADFSFNAKPKKAKAEKTAASEVPKDSGDDDLGLEEE